MRLDLNFLRKLLLKIDNLDTFDPITTQDLTDNDTPINKVNAYLDILGNEDLIEIFENETEENYTVKYITLRGQALIDKIKNKNSFEMFLEHILDDGMYSLKSIINYFINS